MLKYYVKENSLYEVRYNGKDIAFYFENVYDNQINLINYAKSS